MNNWRLVIVGELSNGWVEISRVKVPSNELCVDSAAFPSWRIEVLEPAPDRTRLEAHKKAAELMLF